MSNQILNSVNIIMAHIIIVFVFFIDSIETKTRFLMRYFLRKEPIRYTLQKETNEDQSGIAIKKIGGGIQAQGKLW